MGKNKLFKRIASCVLIVAHVLTVGPTRDALAFNAESASYKLRSGTLTEGGKDRSAQSADIRQDVVGEPSTGKSESVSYILNSGFIPTLQPNPPQLIQPIPNQGWPPNEPNPDAFDLDDYFISPDGYELSYEVRGNINIDVEIDPDTHLVSFSQPENWYGTEEVIFTATDTEQNFAESNEVSLQVEGSGVPPVLDYIPDITVDETDLVKITPHATDADGDEITYSFTAPLDEDGEWLTTYDDAGEYVVRVTATDSTNLIDSQDVKITVRNVNRPPVLEPIPDITADEGELVTVDPQASDPDNDPIDFYYTEPLDETGKWLTTYEDAGEYTATVTASDGIDTVEQEVGITINNVPQPPEATLILDKYTVAPEEIITITLYASDLDGDPMTFSIEKDGEEIASGDITDVYFTTTSFESMGDKTITAIVTDSEGLFDTDSKGVDVVDPNVNRDSINSLMGDYNGDALTDLGLHNSDTGAWEICISDEGVFRNAVDWLRDFGTSKDWWPMGGDFNGDGQGDVGIYNNKAGELRVALSDGVRFSTSGTWLTASFASYIWQPVGGNFNGDKYSDFALYNKNNGEIKVALGTGEGFGEFSTWIEGFGNDYVALGGDFNGDGLTDVCLFKKSSGEFKVAFSSTKAFVDEEAWISGFATDKDDLLVSDFNNDGLTDIGYWDKDTCEWLYAISTGEEFVDKGTWLENFGSSVDESASTGDFNGDGITDAAVFDKDKQGIDRWTTRLSTNKPTGLLTEIDNGIGGKTEITYTYASKYENDLLPFPVYVASSVSLVDMLPAGEPQETYTQDFSYSGGYYDADEREFRGFARTTVTDPITGNYTETYFYQGKPGQDGALKGKVEEIIAYDGNGCKISEVLNTYEVKTAGPQEKFLGFPSLKEVTVTVWEENATFITTKDKFTYDNIGNLTYTANEGDALKAGDERYSQIAYARAYEDGFNRPQEVTSRDENEEIVSKKRVEYDLRGNPIKEEVWFYNPLTGDEQWIPATYTYDSFGNITSTTDAKGSTVTTKYETVFYAFPESISNSLGHTIRYVYDPKFGITTSTTDTNGATSTVILDSLGRTVEEINALNQTVTTYSYPDFNTKVTTRLNLTTIGHIDGLGRGYKTVSSGEDEASLREVVGETFYNNRGLVEKRSLPHYIDEDPYQISYVRYEHDLRGRVKKTISDFPGGLKDTEALINYIDPLYVETTNARGSKKGIKKDVYGNVIEITEFTSGGVYHTYYEYDVQDNLIKLIDTKGNIREIFYDSLGRKLKMIDPDTGVWTYEYDKIGNLIRQTDAKGQVLEFEYDEINRPVKKSALSIDLAVYLYDDDSKDNCIGRASKVTDQSGSTEFFYDKLGREIKSTKIIDGIPYTVERSYDVLDRLTTLIYPDNEIVEYSYDTNSGFLERVYSVDNGKDYVSDITYNASGQIVTIQYGNNTHTDYSYGSDLRLNGILTVNSTSTFQELYYDFDLNGNLTTLTDNLRSNTRTFDYDDLDRLTRAENIPQQGGGYTNFYYRYDAIGNMTYKSDVGVMEYGIGAGPHALTSAGGYYYQYDANGNMISGRGKTFEYDIQDRLIEVDELGEMTSFVYDGDGGRVKKISPVLTTTYIGSLFEINSDGTTKKHIFTGSQLVCSVTHSESLITYIYYHSDHLGSSSVISDENGNKVASYEYQPYGKISQQTGTDVTAYKFNGKELDNTGLYFYSARYYDPEIGRFISADPTVQHPYDPQDLNRYSYCRNNPLNLVDPSGLGWFKKFWRKASGFVASALGTLVGAINPLLGIMVYSAIAASGQGGNFGKNFGVNFLSGLAGYAVGAAIPGGGSFWSDLAAASLGGAAAGAVTSAVLGGDIGTGALAGFVGGAISSIGGNVWSLGAEAVAGGVSAEIMGGDFGEGALDGTLHSMGQTVGGILAPMKTLGEQDVQEGDIIYFKPGDIAGWGIALFEGGIFSHTGTAVGGGQMAHSSLADGGTAVVPLKDYKGRRAYVSRRFRGNQRVSNAARALGSQKPQMSYGFLPGQRACSTFNATALRNAGYTGWHGIGPNSQARYNQFHITRTYAR